MKRLVILILGMTLSLQSMGQLYQTTERFGIIFNKIDNYGISYKTGTETTLWRFNVLYNTLKKSSDISEAITNVTSDYGIRVISGVERRKELDDKFHLKFGGDISFAHHLHKTRSRQFSVPMLDGYHKYKTKTIGLNLMLGLDYTIGDKLIIGVELLPGISFSKSKTLRRYRVANSVILEDKERHKGELNLRFDDMRNATGLISVSYKLW